MPWSSAGPPGRTPSTIEGPFHGPAPVREPGAIIATGAEWQRGGMPGPFYKVRFDFVLTAAAPGR
jgi:hypothetical protein